jgi:hypothetical protein
MKMITLLVIMITMTLSSSFVVRVSTQLRRSNSKLYMNEFARKEPPKADEETEIKETKKLLAAKEEEEKQELSNSMRTRLLQEIRDGGGDPNYSKGAVAGNPILLISFLIAGLAIASYAIGAL